MDCPATHPDPISGVERGPGMHHSYPLGWHLAIHSLGSLAWSLAMTAPIWIYIYIYVSFPRSPGHQLKPCVTGADIDIR